MMTCDLHICHYPLMFAQGDEAYDLIDRAECEDLKQFAESLVRDYKSETLPPPQDGEKPSFNYLFLYNFRYNNESYRFAYTTKNGGFFTFDMIKYEELDL
jgi:hypothetical protein